MNQSDIIKIVDDLECEATENCGDKECYECNFIGHDGKCELNQKISILKEYINKEGNNERC